MKRLKKLLAAVTICTLFTGGGILSPVYEGAAYVQAAIVKLNVTNSELTIGATLQLKLNGAAKTTQWYSNNEKIAKVSKSGLVTGMGKGTVKITATTGAKKYTSTIKVIPKELTATEVYQKTEKATAEVIVYLSEEEYSLGSGFFIDTGVLVTNYHVVAGGKVIGIVTYDGEVLPVTKVLGYDSDIDIAILKVDSKNEVLTTNTEGVTVGETVYSLGSPLGLTATFAEGMISSASRALEGVTYVQTTAPMSRGNSGGPLLNRYGQVMGINTWQVSEGQNLNFSIHIKELERVKTSNPITVTEFHELSKDDKEEQELTYRISKGSETAKLTAEDSLSLPSIYLEIKANY
jgi:S1-C subfamily serine protease